MSDYLLTLPPAALREFKDKAEELLNDLAARYAGHPDAMKVSAWFGAVPRKDES
jgi:hypothetical protein